MFSVVSLPVLRSFHVQHVLNVLLCCEFARCMHVSVLRQLMCQDCEVQGKGAEVQVCQMAATLRPIGSEVWLLSGQCPVNTRQDSKHVGLTHVSVILSNVCHIRTDGKFQFEFQVFNECYPWQELGWWTCGLDKNSNAVLVRLILKRARAGQKFPLGYVLRAKAF